MTEQSKIPVPRDDATKDGRGKSSLERAVETFNLGKFAPPPMPAHLAPDKPRMALRRPAPAAEAEGGGEARPAPQAASHHKVEAEPEIEPTQQAAPAAAAAPPPAPVLPVAFSGERHPVDRQALRDQGLIEPGAKVTALLEEFRIVKRQLLANAADLRRRGAGAPPRSAC